MEDRYESTEDLFWVCDSGKKIPTPSAQKGEIRAKKRGLFLKLGDPTIQKDRSHLAEVLVQKESVHAKQSHAYRVVIGDSNRMVEVADESVHLTVTSPPYPMVAIWDDFFAQASATSYDSMHEYLNETWREVARVTVSGGLACINIGDATRTRDGIFHLYPNHSRIIENFEKLGFVALPYILWKKPTTKPHYKGKGAFLGSGFLPPNAYVTLDMEYILIFRKGPPRSFPPKDPQRYDSKFTKKERDEWFSQVWNVTGARQDMDGLERRLAAFPEEIPRRLIRMFSIIGDVILDPFLGSGTTLKVAIDLDRKFVGYEKLPQLAEIIKKRVESNHRLVEFLEQVHFSS